MKDTIFLMIITIASILGAVIVMWFYVVPWIIRPVESITRAMTDLAAGDTSVAIPARERSDELGRMAQALGVFRDTATGDVVAFDETTASEIVRQPATRFAFARTAAVLAIANGATTTLVDLTTLATTAVANAATDSMSICTQKSPSGSA